MKAGLKGLPPGIASTGFPGHYRSAAPMRPSAGLGTNSRAFNEAQNTVDLQNNVMWTKGRHNITFGFQFQTLQDNENIPLTGTQAGFTFSNNETANFSSTGTLISTTGLGYAGLPAGRGGQQCGDPELGR